jgi:hypothetical protein
MAAIGAGAAKIGRRLTEFEFTDPVHLFFTLDPTKVDDLASSVLSFVKLRWLVVCAYNRMLTRWAFHACAAACALILALMDSA